MNHTLCWTDIPVRDLGRAIAFYSAVLGADVLRQSAGQGMEFGLLPGYDKGVSGCLSVGPDQVPSHHGPLVYLSVNGRLDAALVAAVAAKGKVLQPKHQIGAHGFRALIEDTEGNRIALHSMTA
jgi:predicted enzyme related to lactoylglutathione lyase